MVVGVEIACSDADIVSEQGFVDFIAVDVIFIEVGVCYAVDVFFEDLPLRVVVVIAGFVGVVGFGLLQNIVT